MQPGILVRRFCFVYVLSRSGLNFLILAADPEEVAPQSPPPAAAVLSPSRRVDRISVKQSMFMRTHKAATQSQAAKLSKASSKKKRKRDSAEKTAPVEVHLEAAPPVETTAAADIVLVVPRLKLPSRWREKPARNKLPRVSLVWQDLARAVLMRPVLLPLTLWKRCPTFPPDPARARRRFLW